jgi:hypothetical protein
MIAPTVRRLAALNHLPGLLVAIGLAVAALAMAPVIVMAQDPEVFVIIRVVDCEEAPAPGSPPLSEGTPTGCEPADGVSFTVYDLDDTVLGTCTTDATGSCDMILPVAEGTEVVIEEDESTVTPGYAPIENPLTGPLRLHESIAEIQFFNIPEETSELPDTGAGSGVEMVPGSLTPNPAGLLAVLAVILGLGGAVLRRDGAR